LARVFLGIGSNLADRAAYLKMAIDRLGEVPFIRVAQASSVYETDPWGNTQQGSFLNQAVELETSLEPLPLLEACQSIERGLGRERTEKWGARTIDIDILLYEVRIVERAELRIPHPRLRDRRFVLVPLAEIAPAVSVPLTGLTVADLLKACKDAGGIRLYDPIG
jgi:2-amino-4-hydroxy-6-hydroxymethyldihydropteridine diphosphokinase